MLDYKPLIEKVTNIKQAIDIMGELRSNSKTPVGLKLAYENATNEFCIAQVRSIQEECCKLKAEYETKNIDLPTQTNMRNTIQSTSFPH